VLALQHQLGGSVRVLSTDAQEDAIARAGRVFHFIPQPPGLAGVGAIPGQPKNWPTVWSTDDDFDLQSRLARLPFMSNGLGDITSDIAAIVQQAPELLAKLQQILTQAGPHLDTILQIAQDPALPQVIERLQTLKAQEAAKAPVPADGSAPATSTGSGVDKLIPVLDTAIFLNKHPAAQFALDHPILVGAGAAVVLAGLGAGIVYGVSRWRAKRHGSAGVGRRYRRRR